MLYSMAYAYAWALPGRGLLWRGQFPGNRANGVRAHWLLGVPADSYLTAVGIVLLIAAPWVTAAVAVAPSWSAA